MSTGDANGPLSEVRFMGRPVKQPEEVEFSATPDEPLSEAEREALGRAVMDKDRHDWVGGATQEAQWESLRLHYVRDADRFFAPAVERIVAARVAAARAEERERIAQAIEARRDQLHAAFERRRGMSIAARIARDGDA